MAADTGEDVNQLKAELGAQKQRQAELEDRINQLEARQKLTDEKPPTAEPKKEEAIPDILKWASKVNLYGDFRYRYEYIDQREAEARSRNRIRARLGLNAKVNDEFDLGFRVATGQGEVSGDPVSTNQTLDEAFSKKPIWLDLAFLGYHPNWMEGLDAFAGKIENPFYKVGKNELIWDNDLTPEGGALVYGLPLGEQTALNLAGGGFWVNEESGGADTSLWGIQAYLKHQLSKPTYILGGASLYCYGNIQGEESLAAEWDDDPDEFFGNSNAGGVFTSDYDLLELFAEFGTELAGLPVAAFGDWVHNSVAVDESEDTGWLVGAIVNKVKKPGSWQFEYDYRDIELDAVVAQFNSSDFIGGGTGGKGHRFSFTYQLVNNVAMALTWYDNQFQGRNDDVDYDRVQADLLVKF